MPFTSKALASVWLVVLGLFALSASDMVVGADVLWLALVGLVTPAIILTLAAKPWRSAATTAPLDARPLAPATRE